MRSMRRECLSQYPPMNIRVIKARSVTGSNQRRFRFLFKCQSLVRAVSHLPIMAHGYSLKNLTILFKCNQRALTDPPALSLLFSCLITASGTNQTSIRASFARMHHCTSSKYRKYFSDISPTLSLPIGVSHIAAPTSQSTMDGSSGRTGLRCF